MFSPSLFSNPTPLRASLYTRHLHRITTCRYHDLLAFVPFLSPSPLLHRYSHGPGPSLSHFVLYLQAAPWSSSPFVLLLQYVVSDLSLSRRHVLLCDLVQNYLQKESGPRHGSSLEQKRKKILRAQRHLVDARTCWRMCWRMAPLALSRTDRLQARKDCPCRLSGSKRDGQGGVVAAACAEQSQWPSPCTRR